MTPELNPEQVPIRENEFISTAVLESPEQPLNEPLANSLTERFSSVFHRTVEYIGDQALSRSSLTIATRLAVGALAFGGLGLASAESSASAKVTPTVRTVKAHGSSESQCVDNAPDTVSLSYVDGAVLPLAEEVVDVYQHTKLSEKRELKTRELYANSYQHVTEIDAYIPTQLANGHGKGTYILRADFTGRIIPQDIVAVEIEEYPKILGPRTPQSVPSTYDFLLEKSTTNGPSNTVGLHWLTALHYDYGEREGYYFVQSELSDGSEVPTSYSMTAPILSADTQQANGMLVRAQKHQPIERLKDLAASQQLVQVCS
jgi:hypothetical protein